MSQPPLPEVDLVWHGYDDFVNLSNDLHAPWPRVGMKAYLIHIIFHAGRKQFCAELAIRNYNDLEFKGTKYQRPSESGDYTCFARTIPEVQSCIKETLGISTRIVGITPEKLREIQEREYEDAVAPKPHEIGLFEVMESNSEQVLQGMGKDIGRFCTQAGVGRHVGLGGHDFAYQTCKNVLEGLVENLDLEIPNEDWDSDLKYGRNTSQQGQVSEVEGRRIVKVKLNEILIRSRESAEYRAEELWGVAPREPYKMGEMTKAQQIAERLMEPFETGKREQLNSIGDETARKLESDRLKDAIRLFLTTYAASMKRRVQQLQ